MTKAVLGTVKSSTAYSGGSLSSMSESSSDELSGSRASSGPFGADLTFDFLGFSTGSRSASDFIVLEGVILSSSFKPGGAPLLVPSCFEFGAGAGTAPGAPPFGLPARLPTARSSSCGFGGCHNFFSFQPEFAKSSDIGRFTGPRGANAGEYATAGPHGDCWPPPPLKARGGSHSA